MHRFLPGFLAFSALALIAAVPASRVPEPNAIFTYAIHASEHRIQATLFDRLNRRTIDTLDATTTLPVFSGGSTESNDLLQFSPATGNIYLLIRNISGYDGSVIDPSLPYDSAIVQTNFDFDDPTVVFSCNECDVEQWIVHPTHPKLYVSLTNHRSKGTSEFHRAKLVEVTLAPKRRTRVIGRIPSYSALHITPNGTTLHTFKVSQDSRPPYGAVVTVNLRSRKRSQTIVNLPMRNIFDLPLSPSSFNVSPDALEIAYHMSIVDLRTKKTETLIDETELELDNYVIGWSRDSSQLLFQLMHSATPNNRTEVPLLYNRTSDQQWELSLQDAHLLDWSPAQTAILFNKYDDIGFYDLEKHEWVFVAQGENGSWVTLPTKKVPKR